ncbi:RICIN domain-containing protein [Jiella endophytica]|nr:RICIN domain-containing protein [Jiella endophytica]
MLRGLAATMGLVLCAMGSASAQQFDLRYFQTLSTEFRGGDMRLDVYNGGPKNDMTHLAPAADVSGQYWKLTPAGNGYYRLTTMFRGQGMCLDVFNGGQRNNQVHLAPCGNYSGQFWRFQRDGETYRLTTQFRGPKMCLDIYNGGADDNEPHLTRCANYSGQFWQVSPTWKEAR